MIHETEWTKPFPTLTTGTYFYFHSFGANPMEEFIENGNPN